MERLSFWICIALFSISNIQGQLTDRLSIECPQSESSCGENICYNPITENCTKTKVVQCIDKCTYQCYNPTLQRCINETICRIDEQLCLVKYNLLESSHSVLYYQCYNPSYEACLNNSLCPYPSRICNNQCLTRKQICVDNTTVCNTNGVYPYYSKQNKTKSCNGQCYDSTIQQCVDDAIRCISDNCSGKCFNSSSEQCLNGTICKINEQLCTVGYSFDRYQCYDPSVQACVNNSLQCHPEQLCNQQCLQDNQICVDNSTICNIEDWYDEFDSDQMKSCNGTCYNSAVRQCVNGSAQCIGGTCSGKCYNSSLEHCLNETLCQINEQLCIAEYNWIKHQCYNPSTQACLGGRICDYPSRSCNNKCLRDYQICVDNVTICDVEGTYNNSQAHQIKLCNGVCYNSTIEQCADEYKVHCIRYPWREKCLTSSAKHQSPLPSIISILMVICAFLNFS